MISRCFYELSMRELQSFTLYLSLLMRVLGTKFGHIVIIYRESIDL